MCLSRPNGAGALWTCCICGYQTNSRDFCTSCDRIVCEKIPGGDIPLLVVGCPRSGTKYAAQILQVAGAEVGHEWLHAHGIVSCHMTVESPRWRIPSFDGRYCNLKHHLFKGILHQVREPLATIRSLCMWLRQPWAQLLLQVAETWTTARIDHCNQELAMRLYCDWNLLGSAISEWTYRVEDIAPGTEFEARVKRVIPGFSLRDEHIGVVPKNSNKTEGTLKPLDWAQLEEVQPVMADQCKRLGRRYGYKID